MLWGRNDQAVTANSTTTMETSNGAPIGTYALVMKGGGPNAHFGNTSGTRAGVDVNMFGNSTPGAFVPKLAVGVFGADASEAANTKIGLNHAGWQVRRAGTGSIINVGYTGTANGYNNTDLGVIASPAAGGNGSFSFTTNATGGALTITITNPGFGFTAVNATPNVSVTNSTGGATSGTGATFTAVAGGRAGRVQYETLVAMGSLGAQTAAYGTPANVSDGDTLF